MAEVNTQCGVGYCQKRFSSMTKLREHKLEDHSY